MNINKKRIVLTGAASGIGNALFKQLSLYDTNLVCADMIKENLWKNKIKTTNHKFFSFQCDLSKPEEIDKLFNFALDKMGGIDLFIANAGIPYYEKISQPDWKHISKIYETNVFSIIYSLEKMMEYMEEKGFHFAVTGSVMGKISLPGYALYSSTKAAIDRFFEGYSFEMNKNIQISVIYPIATKTNFFSKASHPPAPIPWPAQTANKVARAVIKGIEKKKKSIYPYRFFKLTQLPFIKSCYQYKEKKIFKKWLEKK